ncbi:TetR/AcrR family transcriptional regulator [Mangrovicoccus ximenensis]|uniref:TetR/AcrR family transcriptional regulator n=1 Tax=Mangrovicoccus ximenensis TaxID=1911570 RepID=UPI000D34D613|nr:TetR family transcriptional regulator [Mangrovicoccus ximenensis]
MRVPVGRKRVIDKARMLDAIEAVVREDGMQGLSIEAVARECGISKASVLYDYDTKHNLLMAYVRERIEEHQAKVAAATEPFSGGANALLSGLVAASRQAPSEDDMATAVIVSLGVRSDDDLRRLLRESFTAEMARVQAEAADPRRAALAYLALSGLQLIEYLGFNSFGDAERQTLLEDIAGLADAAAAEKHSAG